MTASIDLDLKPAVQGVLRLGDTCLVLSQRLSEWCGHAPVLEEDIALANMALDLLGQSRALLTHAALLEGRGRDEDQLAFLRNERDYFNVTMAELPRGDFAFTVLRNAMLATWLKLLWARLASSTDAQLAAIAGKAIKEARYHQQHAADWVVRLGDGTEESARRLADALKALWPYARELFDVDAVDEQVAADGAIPKWSDLRDDWLSEMGGILAEAGSGVPSESAFRSDGKRGRHSEHMGFILAELQYLQRTFPGGTW